MIKQRRSPIWKISSEEFKNLFEKSECLGDMLKYFSLENKGSNPKTLKNRLIEENIDYSKFHNAGIRRQLQKIKKESKPLSEVLVEHSSYNRGNLKKRLIANGLLKNLCSVCGIESTWNNKPLVMVLDHINGVPDDNRIDNLRLVCPNCNSQLPTFCGRHTKKKTYFCIDCGEQIIKNSTRCKKCATILSKRDTRKVPNPPSRQEIEVMLQTMSMCAIGRKYGVSDNAVRKWMK